MRLIILFIIFVLIGCKSYYIKHTFNRCEKKFNSNLISDGKKFPFNHNFISYNIDTFLTKNKLFGKLKSYQYFYLNDSILTIYFKTDKKHELFINYNYKLKFNNFDKIYKTK